MKKQSNVWRAVAFCCARIFSVSPARQAASVVLVALANVVPALFPLAASIASQALTSSLPAAESAAGFWRAAALAAGLYLAMFVLWRGQDALVMGPAAKILAGVRVHTFRALFGKSWRFHADRLSGTTGRDATRLADAVDDLWTSCFYQIIPFFVTMAVSVAAVMAQNVALGAFVAVWIASLLSVSYAIFRWSARYAERYYGSESELAGRMGDVLGNAQAVWLFSDVDREERRLGDAVRDFRRDALGFWWSSVVAYGAINLLLVVFIALLGFGAAHLYAVGTLSAASALFVFLYVFPIATQSFDSVAMIRSFYRNVARVVPALDDLAEPVEVADRPGAPALAATRGAVVFRNVTFGYDPARPVVRGLDLEIAPGERLAVVGASGAGKSTLTRLLLRFFDVQSGRIEIDGQDVAAVTQDSLRAAVSVVPQEPWLLHRSIRENVALGREGATDAQVWAALELAQARAFVEKLPGGLDAVVGERGVKLSGGERQRLCIARAALKDAPVVVLDEPTSALDSASERAIQAALEKLLAGRTSLTIAHRLSTVMRADRIVVMEHGKIAEQGTHAQLLAAGGLYAKLWDLQAGGMLGDGEGV